MDQREKQALIKQLIEIASNSIDLSRVNLSHGPKMILGGDGFTFCLLDNVADQYNQLVKQLQKRPDWKKKFSKKHIDRGLHGVLAQTVKDVREDRDTTKATEYIDQWVAELESYLQENTTYLPLAGIHMDVDELEIGKITLLKMNDACAEKIARNIEMAYPEVQWTDEQKERVIHSWLNKLRGKVCAKFTDIAEPERLRERTEEEIEHILDLLRYSVHMMGLEGYRISVGLWGEVVRINRDTPVISSDYCQISVSSQAVGPLVPFIISDQTIERMRELGVFKVAQFLKKGNVSGFNEVLLRGIHWFANAQNQVENRNTLLSLMTCLETFLSSGSSDRISNSIAEGVAFVLATKGEERRALKETVKNLYKNRSGVSHGGDKEVTDEDLNKIRNIAGDFLERMIHMSSTFQSRGDLEEWIEKQKFGVEITADEETI